MIYSGVHIFKSVEHFLNRWQIFLDYGAFLDVSPLQRLLQINIPWRRP